LANLGVMYSSIPGITTNILSKDNGVALGGGIRGIMPQHVIGQDADSSFARTRFTLRDAWNTTTYPNKLGVPNKRIIGPFRAVNNSGDVLSRDNYSCGGGCQTFQSRPNMHGLSTRFGAIHSNCDETLVPPAACNVKYVYDSSDYIRFKKHQATNHNYNDHSNGGDDSSASQSAIRAIRRH